jgi:uncharacterized protein YciI
MMALASGISHEEAEAIVSADPSHRSGLLVYQIRPWMLAFPPKGN